MILLFVYQLYLFNAIFTNQKVVIQDVWGEQKEPGKQTAPV